MWILPKSLISAFAPGTEALTLDSVELSRTCERSLIRRSKPSRASSYLREWKAGNLTRLRFGAISSLSLGQSFLERWTSSLADIPASHSVPQDNGREKTTQDIFGPISQKEFAFSSPEPASLKMSKDTFRWDSPASSAIWKNWVTKCRGEYTARLSAARLTNGSVSSSWPTATARDWKDTTGLSLDAVNPDGTHRNRRDRLVGAIAAEMSGLAAQVNPSTNGNHLESSQNLNPRWTEALMGLPVGWTMPSCQNPMIPENLNCDY